MMICSGQNWRIGKILTKLKESWDGPVKNSDVPHKVFLDSDVVISALLSDHGASGWLIRDANIQKWVSNLSQKRN